MMELKFNVPFRCPKNSWEGMVSVFQGEYDLPIGYEEPPTILDLGANYGAFSMWASHRWPGAQIYSYEPNPDTFKICQENLTPYPRVALHNWGIGKAGTRFLYFGPENHGGDSLYPQQGNTTKEGFDVKIEDPLTLPKADILKMDMEGAEMETLEPLLNDGRSYDAIMLEYHRALDRMILEKLLEKEYILIGAHIYNPGLGVLRYMHRRNFEIAK